MKIKVVVLSALLAMGVAASLALAAPSKPPKGHAAPTGTETTTGTVVHAPKPKCDHVDLGGVVVSGSIVLTVNHANKKHSSLVGQTVTVTVPADAKIHAHACAVDDTLVLRGELKVHVPHAPKP